jgi:hypothetical protein
VRIAASRQGIVDAGSGWIASSALAPAATAPGVGQVAITSGELVTNVTGCRRTLEYYVS